MRRFALALAATLLAPAGAGAFHTIGPVWPDGVTNIHMGKMSYWWEINVRRAADEWTDHTSFRFRVYDDDRAPCSWDGTTLQAGGIDFGPKLCGSFEIMDPNILAVTQFLWDDQNQFTTADITFNDAWEWAVYDGDWRDDRADFHRVALHELGHFLGLDHEDGVPSIMSTYAGNIDDLQPDDINGAESLYGNYTPPPDDTPESSDPVIACRIHQRDEAGRLCKKHLKCAAKYTKNPAADPGGAARDACIASAQASFVAAWDDAIQTAIDAGAACTNEDAGATVEPAISGSALQLETDIGPGNAASAPDRKLRAKLMKLTASLCGADFSAWEHEAVDEDAAALADAIAAAAASFTADAQARIDAAGGQGVVYDGAAPGDLAMTVEALAEGIGTATAP